MPSHIISSRRLLLRPLHSADITQDYLAWLNDPQITKFLEIRHVPQTYEVTHDYLQRRAAEPDSPHWGVFDTDGQRHVGTVTLNHTHHLYKTADISFVIGRPEAQGLGYATEAVHAVCAYCFTTLGLHKLTGGHYASHVGSLRVFQKNGFSQEGLRRSQVINAEGQREDVVLHGLLSSEFHQNPRWLQP